MLGGISDGDGKAMQTALEPLVGRAASGAHQSLAPGLALKCDRGGVVREVLSNEVDLSTPLVVGESAAQMLPAHEAIDFDALLADIQTHRATFGWSLHVHTAGGVVPITLEAIEAGGDILLVGTLDPNDTTARESRLKSLTRELARKNFELEQLANSDSLTGVSNRRHLMGLARIEIARAKRRRTPLSLVLADLDGLQRINDACGMLPGDAALQLFARVAQAEVRATDVLARMGGDEFVMLLPETDLKAAPEFARQVRSHLHAERVAAGQTSIFVSSCFGATQFESGDEDLDALLSRADEALCLAKAEGFGAIATTPGGLAAGR